MKNCVPPKKNSADRRSASYHVTSADLPERADDSSCSGNTFTWPLYGTLGLVAMANKETSI